MFTYPSQLVLGSRSPRRQELLQLLLPAERIEILTPLQAEEPGFEDLHRWQEIEQQVQLIARMKNEDVSNQLKSRNESEQPLVLTADTVIVAPLDEERLVVLGQPPETSQWQETVRFWFQNYLIGQTHWAVTATCLSDLEGRVSDKITRTAVTFRNVAADELEWYLSTEEPRGKAGGYAIQGAGSTLVQSVEGSLSNVVGLPLETLISQFEEWGCHDRIQ